MKHWNEFVFKINLYLTVCESHSDIDKDLSIKRVDQIKNISKILKKESNIIFEQSDSFGFFHPLDEYIDEAKSQIIKELAYLKISNTYEVEIDAKFEAIFNRVKVIGENWTSTGRFYGVQIAGIETNSIHDEKFQEAFRQFVLPIFEFYKWYKKELNKDEEETVESSIVKSLTQQINFLHKLGVLEFLQEKYPMRLENNYSEIAILLSQVLRVENKKNSILPVVRSLLMDDARSKSYPADSKKIIDRIGKLS
jgi:hypothetical protein